MATKSAVRISKLPNDVRVHILTFLPLREAAKSSVLSSKWRNLWTNLPTLVIDESICKSNVADKVMLNIQRVLLLHGGPLKDFSLSHSWLRPETYHILRMLPYQNLESLTIEAGVYSYKVPNQVFSSFYRLKKLFLSWCEFTFSPISFEGFERLTVVKLQSVMFQKNLTQLRFKCPLLTTLTFRMWSWENPIIVIVEAPNLSFSHFDGSFASLRFHHTPRLKDVIIDKQNVLSKGKKFGPDLLETNGGLAAVESLSVGSHFYEYLATGVTPDLEDICEPWKKLRRLRLDGVCLSTGSHLWSVVCMIIASPNLQQLSILMMKMLVLTDPDTEGFNGYSEALHRMQSGAVTESVSDTRRMLTRVEVKIFKRTRNEMTFIEWLLNISPMLEKMNIQLYTELSDAEKLLIMAELNGFQRASIRARITLK